MSAEVLLMKVSAPALAAVVVALLPLRASAQTGSEENYEYRFEDDPMSAVAERELSDLVRVRCRLIRTTLIRPRTQFVPELLKSVERL